MITLVAKRIPITVVTGFLGAGKTTLINQILPQEGVPRENIAIIVNEFGEVGIDHQLILDVEEEVFQLNNGCICCSLREDLLSVLMAMKSVFLEQDVLLKKVIIETTGLSDPLPIIQTIIATAEIQDFFELDSVLTVVDASNYYQTISRFTEVTKQISCADKLFLSKIATTTRANNEKIRAEIRELNPLAAIQNMSLNTSIKASDFFDLALFDSKEEVFTALELAESNADQDHCEHHHDHSHHAHEGHVHQHDHGFSSITLRSSEIISSQQMMNWLNWLLLSYSTELYRYKGVIRLKKEGVVALQGVGMHYKFEPFRKAIEESVVVLIGQDLPISEIEESFNEMLRYSMNKTVR